MFCLKFCSLWEPIEVISPDMSLKTKSSEAFDQSKSIHRVFLSKYESFMHKRFIFRQKNPMDRLRLVKGFG